MGTPEGGDQVIWDSDYAEYGVLEHARHRFLSTARAVVSLDIDELVLTKDGSSIFDIVQRSDTGHVRFDGRWIENATSTEPDPARRRHKHYSTTTRTSRWRSTNGPWCPRVVRPLRNGAFMMFSAWMRTRLQRRG